MLDTFFCIR